MPSNDRSVPRNPQQDGRSCPHCGGGVFGLIHQWPIEHERNSSSIHLGFWECMHCKLAILHPIPTASELPDNGNWFSDKRHMAYRNPRFKAIRSKIQNSLFGSQRQRLIRQTLKAKKSGRLLDVGCGNGNLLTEAQRYYECVGVEPSAKAAAKARAKGFTVIESMFEDAAIENESFDVVMMDSVLEHVYDPVEVLSGINQVLKPGGVVVVKLPKLWGHSHRRHGREWNGYRVAYHTVLFSGATLGNVFRAAGFEPLKHPRRDRMFDDILILWGQKISAASTNQRKAA